MSEFETDEERHQAAIGVIARIGDLHSPEGDRCQTCGYAHPCKTLRIIQDYKKKFSTRTDAILDAIYQTYPVEDLNNRDNEIGVLANRISATWSDLLASGRLVPVIAGMMFWISLDDSKAFQAALAIEAFVAQVRA